MMKRNIKNGISLLVVSAMLISSLAGCGNKEKEVSKESSSNSTATSVEESSSQVEVTEEVEEKVDYDVTLNWLTVGYDGPDKKQAMEEINAILEEKLGVTLEVDYVPDANTYTLAIATEKNHDIVVSHDWLGYLNNVKNGVYLELTDEDLQAYAPDVWEANEEKLDILNTTKVGGKRYAIGQTYDMEMSAFIYRGDLADKYGIGVIESFEDLEDYLYAIAENEPEMLAWDLPSGNHFLVSALGFGAEGWVSVGSLSYGQPVFVDADDPNHEVFFPATRPEYKEWVTRMKEWYDAGIFPKSVLSNTANTTESFKAGRSAITREGSVSNIQKIWDEFQADERKNWDMRVFEFYHTRAFYKASSTNSVALSTYTKNKEAALATLNEIFTNEELYDLFYYGVEGVNYNKDDEGRYLYVANDTFGSWAPPMKNPDYIKEQFVYSFDGYDKLVEHYNEITEDHLAISLKLDTSVISTLTSAIGQVSNQYRKTNYLGAFEGTVEDTIATEIEEYRKARIDEYIAELQKQLDAWYASQE